LLCDGKAVDGKKSNLQKRGCFSTVKGREVSCNIPEHLLAGLDEIQKRRDVLRAQKLDVAGATERGKSDAFGLRRSAWHLPCDRISTEPLLEAVHRDSPLITTRFGRDVLKGQLATFTAERAYTFFATHSSDPLELLPLQLRPLLRKCARLEPPRVTELAIDQKLRLDAILAVIAEFAIDLPVLVVAEREQQFTGLPLPHWRTVPGMQWVIAHRRS
jgi:hypothetical protein